MQDNEMKEKQAEQEAAEAKAAEQETAEAAEAEKAEDAKNAEEAAEPEVDPKDAKIEELQNRLLRLQADFENFRRRTNIEKEQLSTFVTANVVGKFLKVLDNFEKIMSTKLDEIEELKITGLDQGSKLLNIISLCANVKTLVLEGDSRLNSDQVLNNIFKPETKTNQETT